mgnify:FL=1
MKAFEKCPVCGGTLHEKEVEKILKGGAHTAILHVLAEVCTHCGERLYSQETVKHFEQIRHKLDHQDFKGFKPIGKSFQVA